MMIRHLTAQLAWVVVADSDDTREQHSIPGSGTLERIVQLLVHVEETRLEPRQLEIDGSSKHRAGVRERSAEPLRSEFRLRERLWILVGPLRENRDSQAMIRFEKIRQFCETIHLF